MRRPTSVDRGRGWSTEWKSLPMPLPPLRRRSISPPPLFAAVSIAAVYFLRESCFDTRHRLADLPLQRYLQDRAPRDARLRGAERRRAFRSDAEDGADGPAAGGL